MTPASPPASPRPGPLLIAELAALIALTVADARGLVPLSRTPFLLLLGWASLRLRGLGWRDVGLARPPRFARALLIGTIAGLAIELFAILVTTPLITRFTGTPPDVSEVAGMVREPLLLAVMIVVSWLLAAFGEEMAFRGYLMSRFADAFGRSRVAWIAGLVAVSVFFGIGHGTQGVAGIAQESLSGFWLGLMYLRAGRNLTVPIVAHGVSNTLALILIHFGRYPGVS